MVSSRAFWAACWRCLSWWAANRVVNEYFIQTSSSTARDDFVGIVGGGSWECWDASFQWGDTYVVLRGALSYGTAHLAGVAPVGTADESAEARIRAQRDELARIRAERDELEKKMSGLQTHRPREAGRRQ